MKMIFSKYQFIGGLIFGLINSLSYASGPILHFTPSSGLYPPITTVSIGNQVSIKYTITNLSPITHTLKLVPQVGLYQAYYGPSAGGDFIFDCQFVFSLRYQEFCTLELFVNGDPAIGNVVGGPVLCEQGNPLQCYEPNPGSQLNVTVVP